ncbi:hypothetical protein [Streptomyces sp. NPDC060205]|uniref:hypothetical protein n=1 Tax=Streptomyces sp. NPDC060205 TaxID=3347072 RepID=UPI003661A3A8
MPQPARLVSTIAAPLAFSRADDAPRLEWRAGTRLLVQRGDTELLVQNLDETWAASETCRIPAPWPRRYGHCAVSPAGDLAVFAGLHALQVLDREGNVRWQARHRCWAGCAGHESFTEYADERDHRYVGSGSAGFSADGTLVWAHVRGPLTHDRGRGADEWRIMAAEDGTVLARAATHTAAEGSDHVGHPDPGQMGLTVGEGQDGAPLRWGRWNGRTLTVDSFGDENRVLLAVSPTGDRLLTVTHDQDTLALHRVADGVVEAALSADALPPHPALTTGRPETFEDDETQAFFDYEGGFVDEDTVVVGTVESDEEFGTGRHWLIDAARRGPVDRLVYPFEVPGPPRALGDGTWYTASATESALHVWSTVPGPRGGARDQSRDRSGVAPVRATIPG